MKINKYFTIFAVSFLIFMFLYTFNINFDLNQKLNIANLLMILGLFISLIVAGYLLLIKDIIKSSERERNGITLVLVLLGIIFFSYNPLPKPESFFIEVPRIAYFILTIIIFALLTLIFRRERTISFIVSIFLPFSIQSYLVNIKGNMNYTDYTLYIVILCIAIVFAINYVIDSRKN